MSFRRVSSIVFVFGFACSCLAAESELNCSHLINSSRLKSKTALLLKPIETWADTDLLNNDLDIEVTHATSNIAGSNTMTLRSLLNNLNQFTFRLANTFTISSILLDGRNIPFTRLDSVTVRANFDFAYAFGQTFILKINYGGPATAGAGFGSIVFTTQNSQPLDFTLSEPYYSYTWWPSKDDNDDKALNKIAVTVPSTQKVAANGRLLGTDAVAGGKLKFRYQCSYPMVDYLLMFSATNYNEWSTTFNFPGGSMPLRFMIFPTNDTAGNRTSWENCSLMLGVFESKFGFYPFRNDQYGIYQFGFGGGMEHQTFTGQGGFGESLTSHELGHQWWGDMITCKFWGDIWLNEGFATYCEAIYLQYKAGSTGFPALKTAMAARKPTAYTGSVFRYDTSSTGAIFSSNYAYRKGSWVLHMLRKIAGETEFWQILANYRGLYQYDSATTADFQNVAEATTGQDLDWFFQPWVYEIGGVRYSLATQNQTLNGTNYLMLQIGQTQSGTYPTYRMPIDVRYTDSSGAQLKVILNSARTQWYAIPTNSTASAVTLDNDGWILTTGTTQAGTFAPGPPKVIAISTRPRLDRNLGVIQISFSSDVNLTETDFELRSSRGTPIPFLFAYDNVTFTAKLKPSASATRAGAKLTVKDTITAVISGMVLDGEVSGPKYVLPSGDGLPGGNSIFAF